MSGSVLSLRLLPLDPATPHNLTPLMVAAYYNQVDAAAELLFANVGKQLSKPLMGFEEGTTALQMALKLRSREVATLLLPFEAFLNKEDVEEAFIYCFSNSFLSPSDCSGCVVDLSVFMK